MEIILVLTIAVALIACLALTEVSVVGTDPMLTNYAQGYAPSVNQEELSLASALAPRVPVPAYYGRYAKADLKNQIVVPDTARGIGGNATRIAYTESDGNYNCKPHALEATIDVVERGKAGPNADMRLEKSKIRTLLKKATLAHALRVVAVAHSATAVAGKGVWSNPDIDPIAELNEQIIAVRDATGGILPNRLVMDLAIFGTLHAHPKVKPRLPTTLVNSLTGAQLAAMLINPAIKVIVGTTIKDATKLGATSSKSAVLATDVYLYVSSDEPGQDDPSWMKCFVATDSFSNIEAVRMYWDDKCRSDVIAVDWTEDIQITGSACGVRIAVT